MSLLARIRVPLILLGAALTLALPAVASAADRYVSTTGSDATNDCLTLATPCATIGQAVTQAASADTINIAAGTYSGAGNTAVYINQPKDLSFIGAGSTQTIIDGLDADYLFLYETWMSIGPSTITASFSDLSLKDGYSSSGGGAIRASSEVTFTLNLTRVSVSGSSTPNDGGAIQARNGNVSICDSTFTNNAADVGGAIAALRITIDNCPSSPAGTLGATFTGNTASGYFGGGAIFATKVTADNALFDGNAAARGPGGSGGAINISTSSTEATALDLSRVTFQDNDADSGGAFRVGTSGDVLISDSTFTNNDVATYGGAFRTDGGDVSLIRSTITGNNAAAGAAAEVGNSGALTVEDSTISGNVANLFAGFNVDGEMSITNSTITGNSTNPGGSNYGLLYSNTAIRLRNVTSSDNAVASNTYFAPDLDIVNSIINESGLMVCSMGSTVTGGGNVLTTTVTDDCDGLASPTPTSRVTAASLKLGALADNGGPTKTMAIGHESTALGIAGSPNACPDADQRGDARPLTGCDAGAFERPSFVLDVATSGPGSGTVTGAAADSTPGAIDCGGACSQGFDQDTPVTLTATPASGSTFTGWGGACSGTSSTCTVTMSEARSVTAGFGIAPPPAPSPSETAAAPVAPVAPRLTADVLLPRTRVVGGQAVTVGIRVANTGDVAAASVTACLRLPVTLVVTAARGAVRSGRTMCFRLGTVASGTEATRVITARAIGARRVAMMVRGTAKAPALARVAATPTRVVITPRAARPRVTG